MIKVIKQIICVLLILSMFPYMLVSADDVTLGNQLDLCVKLDFIKTTDFSEPTDFVTKENFAYTALRLAGFDTDNMAESNIHSLILDGRYLKEFTENDLKNGYITYGQAIVSMVCVLGYEQYALAEGEYPQSYITKGADIGIGKKITKNLAEKITYEELAQMIYNTFTIPYMRVTSFNGSNNVQYTKEENILVALHDIYKESGVVTATDMTGLYHSNAGVGKDNVKIGSRVLTTNISCIDYLGVHVKYYYKTSDAGEDILLYIEDSGKSKVLTIKSDDLSIDSVGFGKTKIFFQKQNGATAKVDIAPSAAYIYNGVAYPDMSDDDLKFDIGEITLVSSDGDSEYDVIHVWDYNSVAVSDFVIDDNIIIQTDGTKLDLETDSRDKIDIVDANGNSMYLIDIKHGSIVSIAESNDGSYLRIILVTTTIEGVIKNKSVESNKTYITVDGIPYRLADSFANSDSPEATSMKPGVSARFYIDAFGYIAGADNVSEDGWHTAYLIKAFIDDSNPDEILMLKVMNSKGEISTQKCSDKVSLDAQKRVSGKEVLANLKFQYKQLDPQTGQPAESIRQLIRYKMNSDNLIIEIDKACVGEPMPGESENSLRLNCDSSSSVMYYKPLSRILLADSGNTTISAVIPSNALIFEAPQVIDPDNDEDNFRIRSMGGEGNYRFVTYTLGDKIVADYACIFLSTLTSNATPSVSTAAAIVVESISTALNDDGDVVQKVVGFSSAGDAHSAFSKRTFYTKENNLIPDTVKPGDTIMASFFKSTIITGYRPFYSLVQNEWHIKKNGDDHNPTRTYSHDGSNVEFGRAVKTEGNFLKMVYGRTATDGKNERTTTINAGASTIVVVEDIGNKVLVYKGTVKDIDTYEHCGADCSFVINMDAYGDPYNMVVYKNWRWR